MPEESRVLDQDQVLKYLSDLHARFAAYNNQKETSAWGAIAVWLVGMLGLIGSLAKSVLVHDGEAYVIAVVQFVVLQVIGYLVIRYVNKQFALRSHAADMVGAINNLSREIISGRVVIREADFQTESSEYNDIWGWQSLPNCVLAAAKLMRGKERESRKVLEWLGLALLILPGLVALILILWPLLFNST